MIKGEVLAAEGVGAHQAVDVQFVQAHEGAGFAGPGDGGVVDFADAVLHQPARVQRLDLALEVGRLALPLRRRLGHILKLTQQGIVGAEGVVGAGGLLGLLALLAKLQQAGPQLPVHDEVRVAADGRREVQVGGGAEAVVADVVDAVAGLLHASQQQHVEGLPRRMLADAMHQRHQRTGGGRVVEDFFGQALAGLLEEGRTGQIEEARELLLVGLLVDAVDAREILLVEEAGGGFVGADHEVFDELLGLDTLVVAQAGGLLLLVKLDDELGEFEVEGAALATGLAQTTGHHGEIAQALTGLVVEVFGRQRRLRRLGRQHVGLGLAFFLVEKALHQRVGQAGAALHDAKGQPFVVDAAGLVDGEGDEGAQARHAGPQRAQPVGQGLGQHRNDPARVVDRGAAQAGLAVEGGVFGDVVRDVGDADRDVDLGAAGTLAGKDGVVEVLGGLAVDGDDGQGAQVLAALEVDLAGHFAQAAGVGQHRGWEDAADAGLGDEALDFDVEGPLLAEAADDAALGVGGRRRRHQQLDLDDVPLFGDVVGATTRDGVFLRQTYGARQHVVVDLDVADAAEAAVVAGVQGPGDGAPGTLQHLDDVGDRALGCPLDLGHDDVAVDDAAHLGRGQEGVFARLVVGDKPGDARGLALDGALDAKGRALGGGADKAAVGQLQGPAVVDEVEEHLTDVAAIISWQVEDPRDVFGFEGSPGGGIQDGEHLLTQLCHWHCWNYAPVSTPTKGHSMGGSGGVATETRRNPPLIQTLGWTPELVSEYNTL